jgi:hypothetical protein
LIDFIDLIDLIDIIIQNIIVLNFLLLYSIWD